MFGNFGFPSILLDENESRSIKYRPDINALLDKLQEDGYITKGMVEARRERARFINPSQDMMNKCREGATYVDIEDTLMMQHEIGNDQMIKVIYDGENSNRINVIETKRSWVKSIIYAHKMDTYGSRFPVIPSFKSNEMDTRIVWMTAGLITLVKELWISLNV